MDFFTERRRADPTMHIYHYAPYEPTALKRLMGRYGTREDEVDDLLRSATLVDLLRAVRQSLRASVESYSIKRMEGFYGFEREIDLRDAGSSIVAFEEWLELGEGERPASDHLDRIERYNHDDVVSNRSCATGWSRSAASSRRRPGSRSRGPARGRRCRRTCPTSSPAPRRSSSGWPIRTSSRPTRPSARRSSTARWLLAQLLGWHRREDKATWWDFYRLMDLDAGAARRRGRPDRAARTGRARSATRSRASRSGATGSRSRSSTSVGRARSTSRARRPSGRDDRPVRLDVRRHGRVDPIGLTVDLKRDPATPHPRGDRPAADRPDATSIASGCASSGSGWPSMAWTPRAPTARPATCSWAAGRGPGRGRDSPFGGRTRPISAPPRRLGLALDATVLPIQGPPGSGKTYSGARMIVVAARNPAIASGSRGRATRSSATCCGATLKAADEAGRRSTSARSSTGDADQVLDDDRVVRGEGHAGSSAHASTMAAPTSPPARRGCGRRSKMRGVGRRPVRRRGGPDLARERRRHGRRRRQPRASRRPTAARPADAWLAPARGRSVGAGARPGRRRHDPARPWASSSRRPGDSTRCCAGSRPRSSTTTGSSPSRTSRSSSCVPARSVSTGSDRASSRSRRPAPTTTRPSRPTRSPPSPRRS